MKSLTNLAFALLLFTAFIFASCTQKKSFRYSFLQKTLEKNFDNPLSGKLFFVGTSLDSNRAEVLAPCDCCASNLAFINDSIFICESLCLEGDNFSAGKYAKIGNRIHFQFQPLRVYATHSPGENKESTLSVKRAEVFFSTMEMSKLKSKTVLVYSDKDFKQFAMFNKSMWLDEYVTELKTEKVWEKLDLK